MASLLPNSNIEFCKDETGRVIVDGVVAAGTVNRDKILQLDKKKGSAIQYKDLMDMDRDQSRELTPFHFEGEGRLKVAKDAIKRLGGIDFTLIENQKIFNEADSNTTILDAFKMLDLTSFKINKKSKFN